MRLLPKSGAKNFRVGISVPLPNCPQSPSLELPKLLATDVGIKLKNAKHSLRSTIEIQNLGEQQFDPEK